MVLAAIVAASLSVAAPAPADRPAATAAAAAGVTTVELENGLRIILKEAHERPLVALCAFVNGGSRTERDELKGLSHYYEHTIFRGGTDRQKEEETRRKFQLLGTYSGYTTDDYTAYYFNVPKIHIEEALWRFADALMNLKVTEEKIERDRQSIVQEMHMRVSDSPQGRAWVMLNEAAFRAHPYRIGPIGTEKVVTEAKLDRFKTFYQERYVANQIVLAAVGDFTTDEMVTRLRAQFAKFVRGKVSFEQGIVEGPQEDVREVSEGREASLSYGMVGFKMPDGRHPDVAALEVVAAALASGRASRLRAALIERDSLCSDVWAEAPIRHDGTLFTVGFTAKPENEEKAVKALLAELARLRSEPIPVAELARVRGEIERSQLFEHETYAAQAQAFCQWAILDRPDEAERRRLRLLAVSSEEIQAVSGRTFVSDGSTIAVVRPKAAPSRTHAAVLRAALPRSAALSGTGAAPLLYRSRDKKYGLMQVVKEDRSAPLFSAAAIVRGGPLFDTRPGSAHLAGKAILKGTQSMTAPQVAEKLASLGLALSVETNPDHLVFRMGGPARQAAAGCDLLMKLLAAPAFRPDDVERCRAEALGEIAALQDDSYEQAEREFAAALFGASPAGRHPFGDAAGVQALTASDLADFHKKAFVPRNVYVSVVGDVDGKSLSGALGAAAAALPPGKESPPSLPKISAVVGSGGAGRTVSRDTRQTVVQLGWGAVPADHEDFLALRVAARMLGLRLFFQYVYKDGIAYRMWTRFPARMAASPFFFQVGVSPENEAKARDGLLAAAKALVSELEGTGTMKQELDDVRKDLTQSFQLSLETTAGQANAYAYYEACGLGSDFVDGYTDRVNAVKRGVIAAAAKKVLDPARYTAVTVRK